MSLSLKDSLGPILGQLLSFSLNALLDHKGVTIALM